MAEIQAYALTSLKRLKARLNITATEKDATLEQMINAATGYIERYCNRRFKKSTYTNEVHTVHARGQDMVALRQAPVVTLTAAQYRAGTPSTPSWTSFIADQYEIAGDGKSGIVRIYGGVPYGTNAVRFSYEAGYLIDFEKVTDPTYHTLPDEIVDICERLATKLWKKRDSEGQSQSSFEGGSIIWEELMTSGDKEILNQYVRVPEFI